MGFIGDIIGGIGADQAGKSVKSNDAKAAQQAFTGYNYLTSGPGAAANTGYINNGAAANNSTAQLLGQAPVTAGTTNGFNNYLNSTGYNFQLKSGQDAISGNAASKGILNSGATAKALTTFGQGLGATSFNNYLGQLNNLSDQGQKQLGTVGEIGTAAGGKSADINAQGAAAMGNGIATSTSDYGNAASSLFSMFM